MTKCPICTQGVIDNAAERATNACDACQAKLGLVPMGTARRRGPCLRCGGKKFLRTIPREHCSKNGEHVCAPMFLTHAPQGHRGAMNRSAKELDAEQGHGRLEAYACFGCGAVEWYCPDVAAIPINPHLMTEIVED